MIFQNFILEGKLLQPLAFSLQPIAYSTPAPLHDIVGPLPFFPYTRAEVAIAIALLFLILAAIAWILWKRNQQPPLTPREAALKALVALRSRLMEGTDHDFGIFVSGLLRCYLSDVFGLAAPRQTTEEFLESLRHNKSFTSPEQESIALFLKHSDLLKFAGGKATETERLALVVAAENFLNREGEEIYSS
ncbi:MAG: DUF4381 family protein [Chthoniobacterales bacterium]